MRPTAGITPPPALTSAADTVHLAEVFDVLRRRIRLVAAVTLVGLVAAGVYVIREKPLYRATGVLRMGESRDAVTIGIETPTRAPERYVNPLLSQLQLLKSRSLIREVVDSVGFRLQADYHAFPARLLRSVHVSPVTTVDTLWLEFGLDQYVVRSRLAERVTPYGSKAEIDGVSLVITARPSAERATWLISTPERAVDRLLGSLSVFPRSETNVVDVSFVHPDPDVAQVVVNTLVRRYQVFEAQIAQGRSRSRRIFLEEQVLQTDSSLAVAQRALTAFQTRVQVYDSRQELAAQQQNRLLVEIRREELNAERSMFETLLERLNDSSTTDQWEALRTVVSSPAMADNPVVSQLYAQLLRYRTALDSSTTGMWRTAETNPDMQRLKDLIASNQRELASAIRSHITSLEARVAAMEDLAARVGAEIAALPPQQAEEARLGQLVETYRKMGDQLREEYQKARMAEAVAVGQADIIDLAARPYKPLSRMRMAKLALGLLIGFAFGGGAAFLLEHESRAIRRREDIEALVEAPLLGIIPRARDLEFGPASGNRDVRPSSPDHPYRVLLTPDKGASRDDGGVGHMRGKPLRDPEPNYGAEAYRMLRTNFLFAQWAKNLRSIAITSTAPREGKTITASNLAACIAEDGRSVLLVDGDLWRGRLHEVIGVRESPGLAELLKRPQEWRDALRETPVPGLRFLPRGIGSANPSSLMGSTRLQALLSAFAEDFDLIVVDAPPVLAAAGGPVLAAVADGVLLVVRAGKTRRDAVQEAVRELSAVGAHVLGTVLNDPNSTRLSGAQQHYYAYARP